MVGIDLAETKYRGILIEVCDYVNFYRLSGPFVYSPIVCIVRRDVSTPISQIILNCNK